MHKVLQETDLCKDIIRYCIIPYVLPSVWDMEVDMNEVLDEMRTAFRGHYGYISRQIIHDGSIARWMLKNIRRDKRRIKEHAWEFDPEITEETENKEATELFENLQPFWQFINEKKN